MTQAYSDPDRASDPYALPDIEVFYISKPHSFSWGDEPCEVGWYWWSCFPGCLPDSDEPIGPFKTEAEALENAASRMGVTKMRKVREATNKILDMVEEGLLDKDTVIMACLKYMSEDDVADMAHANEFFWDEKDEDDEDEEAA